MNKAILISIKPRFVADILNGKKTIEIRKTMPKCDLPIDVYIYCSKDTKHIYREFNGKYWDLICSNQSRKQEVEDESTINGQVVAKFTLKQIDHCYHLEIKEICDLACIELKELDRYAGGWYNVDDLYAWRIENLEIFDEPKEISEFKPHYGYPTNHRLTRAPQSWCYIEV